MTPKDRITAAFRNEKPDRVPVSPELWDVIPILVSGRPFYEFSATCFGKTPLWKAQLDAYLFFGCEAWVPVEPGPSRRQRKMVEARSRFLNDESIHTDLIYKTSKGELQETRRSCFDFDLWAVTRPVKDLLLDMPLIEEYFFGDPGDLDYAQIVIAYDETAEAGICEGIVGNSFFEFLTMYREGGAVQVILDLYEHADYLKVVQKRYSEYLAGIAEQICARTAVEGIFLNCGSASLNITSPELFRVWDIPTIKAVADVAGRYDRIFHYHLHGLGRKMLGDLAEAGVTMLCPLEKAPRGDFVLEEVKAEFGSRIALKGGVDPFVLEEATSAQIERIVKECLAACAEDGGYTLATGDGVLKGTSFDKIRLLVEYCRKHGAY